jgi:Activator of Hsp90 ATPase homolog 1-like protein
VNVPSGSSLGDRYVVADAVTFGRQDRGCPDRLRAARGGRVYEVSRNGDAADRGRVVAWDPPHRFVMTWHPGGSPAQATELEVRFAPDGDGTRIQLEHRGWEVYGANAATLRESYDTGWTTVLGHYTRGSNGEGEGTATSNEPPPSPVANIPDPGGASWVRGS